MWIGGWASDAHCWEDALRPALDGFRPRFVSAHALLRGRARLGSMLESLPSGAVLAGWSLGALLVEDLLRGGLVPAGVDVVRICPFLDFCDPAGPWRSLVLRRMVRRIHGDAPGVLDEFAELAGIPAGPLRRAWMDQAVALGEDELVEGLEVLGSLRFSAPWADAPGGFLVSPDDAVAPPPRSPEACTRVLPDGSGHVPFLIHPEAFSLALRELVEV